MPAHLSLLPQHSLSRPCRQRVPCTRPPGSTRRKKWVEEKRRRQRTSPSRCGYPPGAPGARASSSQARPSQRRRGIPTCVRRRAVFQLHGRGRGYDCCRPMGAWGRSLGSTCGVCGLLFVPSPAAVTRGYRCRGGERYRQETEERDYRGTNKNFQTLKRETKEYISDGKIPHAYVEIGLIL